MLQKNPSYVAQSSPSRRGKVVPAFKTRLPQLFLILSVLTMVISTVTTSGSIGWQVASFFSFLVFTGMLVFSWGSGE